MTTPVGSPDAKVVLTEDEVLGLTTTTAVEDGQEEVLSSNENNGTGTDSSSITKGIAVEKHASDRISVPAKDEASTADTQDSNGHGTPDPGSTTATSRTSSAATPPNLQRQSNTPAPNPAHPGAFSVIPVTVDSGAGGGANNNNDNEASSDSSDGSNEEGATLVEDQNTGLAVATAVEDTPVQDLENAREVNPTGIYGGHNSDKQQKKNEFLMLGVCLCGLVALVILLVVLVTGDDDSSSAIREEGNNSTVAPLPSPRELLFPLLPEFTVAKLQVDAEIGVSSPQTLALEWLLGDPKFYNYTETRLRQRFALATFFYAMNGKVWNPDWLNVSTHECEWEYYTPPYTANYNRSIYHKYFYYEFIDGPCDLLNYTLVNITVPVNATSDNTTTVTIMTDKEYGEFRFLSMAYIEELKGGLPEEIKMLTSLNMIMFEGSAFDGSIPTFLGEMGSLEEISFPNSHAFGPIPSELGLLSSLNVLHLQGIEVTGTLPTELAQCANLSILQIMETNVTGTIPTEYGLLPVAAALFIDNQLTGLIPTEFGLLSNAEWLFVDGNNMNGPIPSELGQLEKAVSLYFHENSFTGTIPTVFGALANIRQLQFAENLLTGTMPSEFGNCTEMWRLRFQDNFLTGTLPNEYGNFGKLQRLWGGSNFFTGTIPDLGRLKFLQSLLLSDNQLEGTVLAGNNRDLRRMQDLDLSKNKLTGTVPEIWGTFTLMTSLQLQENYLTGPIIETLGFIPIDDKLKNRISHVNLAHNFFEGTVPLLLQETALSGQLRYLNISGNDGLFGRIPEGVCSIVDPESPELARVLSFDCSERLCGCECSCPVGFNETIANLTLDSDGFDYADTMNASGPLILP